MDGNDIGPARTMLHDLRVAFALLTRLPLPYPEQSTRPAARAAWAYPLVGLAVAGIVWGVVSLTLAVGLPAEIAAGLGLFAGIMITGAMHEDGLADCADGFWGGWTRDRRLEIMKDSQIGAYGVLALVLSLLLRWGALVGLIKGEMILPGLLVAAMGSRAGMVWVMGYLPHAREGGLSQQTGQPSMSLVWIAVGYSAILAALIWPGVLIWGALIAMLFAGGCAMLARRKVGGQTGDVLGSTQQVIEIALLLTCLSHA